MDGISELMIDAVERLKTHYARHQLIINQYKENIDRYSNIVLEEIEENGTNQALIELLSLHEENIETLSDLVNDWCAIFEQAKKDTAIAYTALRGYMMKFGHEVQIPNEDFPMGNPLNITVHVFPDEKTGMTTIKVRDKDEN